MASEEQPRATCPWCACLRFSYKAATAKWVLLNAANPPKKIKSSDLTSGFVYEPVNKTILAVTVPPHCLPGVTEALCQTALFRWFRWLRSLEMSFHRDRSKLAGAPTEKIVQQDLNGTSNSFIHWSKHYGGAEANPAAASSISQLILHISKCISMCWTKQ